MTLDEAIEEWKSEDRVAAANWICAGDEIVIDGSRGGRDRKPIEFLRDGRIILTPEGREILEEIRTKIEIGC